MFGHQNNNDQASQTGHGDQAVADDSITNGLTPETVAPTANTPSAPVVDQNAVDQSTATGSDYVMTDLPTVNDPTTPQPVSTDVADPVVNDIDAAVIAGATPLVDDPVVAAPAPAPVIADTPVIGNAVNTPAPAAGSDTLLELKQSALHDLSPLLGQLEQSPEEKFRTTMMMIQASDDQSLLQSAYDAARQITDEKVRAQALLDVVNEINYFTQQGEAPNVS